MESTKRIALTATMTGVLVAALCVRPVPAGSAPQPPPPSPTAQAMIEALKFRIAAAADTSQALKDFDVGKSLSFITRKALTRARSAAWSTFFAGSLVLLGHQESPQPVVAYYHPLYDVMLITRWSAKGDTAKMTAANLRVASQFGRGEDLEPPEHAAWLDSSRKKPVPDVLSQDHDRLLQAFEKAYPPRATSVADIALSSHTEKTLPFIEDQAMDVIHNLIVIQQTKNPLYNGRLRELRDALVKHEKGALTPLIPQNNPSSIDGLLEIPADIYAAFVPSYAVLSATDSMVFLQHTLFPRYYMLVCFRQAKAGTKPEIRSLLFFELAQKGWPDKP